MARAMKTYHYVDINHGRIEINPPGRQTFARFYSEKNAAHYLARSIMLTGIGRVMNGSSCNWPADYGRPGFDYDAFVERVLGIVHGTPDILDHSGALALPDHG